MLYNSDDKENKSNDSKLFGADNANSNLDDSPAAEGNPDSLFASPLNGTNQTSSHDSLFDTSFSEDDIKANDTIDSSFVVSFKNNDPINSVSDKLKYDNSFDGMDYEDDLADFDFDSSISAFKPLNAPVVDDPKPATPEVKEDKIEEKVEEVKEEVKEEINDLDQQIDEPIDKPIFAPKAATASSAKDLDFAASESTKSSSSFSGHAPVEEPKPFSPVEDNISDDIEPKEEVSPFVPKNEAPVEDKVEESAPVAEAAAAAVASTVADFASEPAKEELSPDQKAFEAFKSSTKQSKPQKDKLEGVQTYGKVSSGVDAFGKSTNAASVEQRAPVKRQANNVRPGAGKQEAAQAAVKRPPRQSTSNSTPFGSTNERRIPPTQRKSAASQTGNIQPVTTVETKKKKSFGVGSIIAAVVLFLILVVVIIGLMFGSKITDYFKGISGTSTTKTSRHHDDDDDEETAVTSIISESKSDPTESTDDTTTEATTTTEETTTEATTTEATTTEATTTEATTTEETTEATTTEATTTEATTTEATTTEATTTETTKKPSNGGGAVTTFYTSMSGFTSNDSGFTCNLVLENYGSKDAQLKDSVNSVKITFNSDKTITNVTSDYFTFEAVPDTKNTFIGTPTSATIEAGEKFKAPITVSTDGKPSHYGYTSCYFDWNK